MIVYYHPRPFPSCRICGKEMDYWVPGLPDKDHEHPLCLGKEMAEKAIKKFDEALRKGLESEK